MAVSFFLSSIGFLGVMSDIHIIIRIIAGIICITGVFGLLVFIQKYKQLIASRDMKLYLKTFDYNSYIEAHRRMSLYSNPSYSTYNDLEGVVFLSINKDTEKLPIYRGLYKKLRSLQRYHKSKAYLLSYLLTNEIEEFLEECEFINKIKENNDILHSVIVNNNDTYDFWSIEMFNDLLYKVYRHNEPFVINHIANQHVHAIYIVLYYQYLMNTEQYLLAEDYKEDYLKITQHKH